MNWHGNVWRSTLNCAGLLGCCMTKWALCWRWRGCASNCSAWIFPTLGARAAEVSEALDGVMEQVRKLSRQLEPSPVRRTGLKNALIDLAEAHASVSLRYTATAVLAPVTVDALYRAIASVVATAAAARGVTRVCRFRRRIEVGDCANCMEWRFSRRGQGPGGSFAARPPLRNNIRFSGEARKNTAE